MTRATCLQSYVQHFRDGMARRLNGSDHAGMVMAGAFRDGYVAHCVRRNKINRRIFWVAGVECWILDWGVGPAECWVSSRGTRHNYREVFRRFLLEEFGIDFRADNISLFEPFQIDHAHCCVSVDQKNDADFVLLTPLEQKVNAAWGPIERALAAMKYGEGPEAICSYLTMGKLLGARPPRYSKRSDVHEQANLFLDRLAARNVAITAGRVVEIDGIVDLITDARKGAQNLAARRKMRMIPAGDSLTQKSTALIMAR